MPRLKKCKVCGLPIQKDEPFIPLGQGKGFAHEHCFDGMSNVLLKKKTDELKEKEKNKGKRRARPQAELKQALSEEEYQEKQRYYDYLKKLLDETGSCISPKIYSLSEDYIKKYGVTFHDLYLTLVYLNEIVQKKLVGDVVGIIPFFISEAQRYFESVKEVEKNNEGFDMKRSYKTKTIMINPQRRQPYQIDITSI